MANCEVCGNCSDKTFQIIYGGRPPMTFDSFECGMPCAGAFVYCAVRLTAHR
jgi:hypothetical protein